MSMETAGKNYSLLPPYSHSFLQRSKVEEKQSVAGERVKQHWKRLAVLNTELKVGSIVDLLSTVSSCTVRSSFFCNAEAEQGEHISARHLLNTHSGGGGTAKTGRAGQPRGRLLGRVIPMVADCAKPAEQLHTCDPGFDLTFDILA